MIFAKV